MLGVDWLPKETMKGGLVGQRDSVSLTVKFATGVTRLTLLEEVAVQPLPSVATKVMVYVASEG